MNRRRNSIIIVLLLVFSLAYASFAFTDRQIIDDLGQQNETEQNEENTTDNTYPNTIQTITPGGLNFGPQTEVTAPEVTEPEDTTAPTGVVSYDIETPTNGYVIATLTTNEEVETPDGWTATLDPKVFTKTFTDNGEEEVTLTDLVGNEALVDVKVSNIDKVAPVVTFDQDGTGGLWTNERINFKVFIEDENELVVAKTEVINSNRVPADSEFKTDFKENQTTTKNYTGEYYLWVYVEDAAGNITKVGSEPFLIDLIAPTTPTITNSSEGKWSKEDVTLTFASDDVHSGVAYYEYATNVEGPWTQVSVEDAQLVLSEEQNTTVFVRTIDNVGNISDVAETVVKIDKTAPVITFSGADELKLGLFDPTFNISNSYDAFDGVDGNIKDLVVVEVDSRLTRVQGSYYKLFEGWKTYDLLVPVDFQPGSYEIKFTVTDSAGNTTERVRTLTYESELLKLIEFFS